MNEDNKSYVPWKAKDAKVVAVHPRLLEELKIRKEIIENEIGRKFEGGITCFSNLASIELWSIRQSGNKILKDILKLEKIPVSKFTVNGSETEFVPYWIFKNLYILLSVLKNKKDNNLIRAEITKLRGLKKNEIKYFW